MKNYILLLFLLFFVALPYGQSQTLEDALLEPSLLLEQELLGQKGNQSVIQQEGNKNRLSLTQVLSNGRKVNLATVLQRGDFNLALIRQEGAMNKLALIQKGTGNVYELKLSGTNNVIDITQDGDGNSIIQNLNNISGLNVELTQIGNQNQIVQRLEGNVENKNIKIVQEGNNLQLEIIRSAN